MRKIVLWICLLVASETWAAGTLSSTSVLERFNWKTLGRQDTLYIGWSPTVTPVFSVSATAGKRLRANLLDLDSLRLRDSLNVMPGSKTAFLPGSIFTAAAIDVDSLTGGNLATGVFNIGTATNWQLGGVAYTGSMANLNTLRDDSMADALHRHSELSASDGSPNPAVSVDAAGNVGIGTSAPEALLQVSSAVDPADNQASLPNYQQLISSTKAAAINVGPGLAFTGNSGNGVTPYAFGAIRGIKNSSTAANYMGALLFSTTNSVGAVAEAMRIDGSGVVGINESTPAGEADKLTVYSNVAAATPVMYVRQDNAGATGPTLSLVQDAVAYPSLLATGTVVVGGGAVATTAVDGFLYVPTCAGTPTGVPTTQTGYAPIVVNTTNNKLYFYSGGAWRDSGP